jgi:dTDP-4-amino-4,6-dideoxygalactose transaminase
VTNVTPTRIHLSPPDLSGNEREYLLAALDSGWIAPIGPDLDAFERELAVAMGVPHVVGLASGTAGLHLALHAHEVGPGDEVLVSTLTFVATANAVLYTGATPVFVDSEPGTWCMDPELLRAELERRSAEGRLPKAVVVVDLYGQCADYGRIEAVCAEHGVLLVEDAAEALGATRDGRRAGSFGACSIMSFNGNKLITTSGGGAIGCHDEDLARRFRYLAAQARQPAVHYEHTEMGFNYRLSNLLAAIGRGQLEQLADKIARRRATKQWYRSLFAGVPGVHFLPDAPEGEPNCWLTVLTVDADEAGFAPADIGAALEAANIESRPVWKPMHLQPQFAGAGTVGGAVAERLFRVGWCMPSGSSLTDADKERIAGALAPLLGRP